MNEFREELIKMLEHSEHLKYKRFVGRSCIAKIDRDDDFLAKVSFEELKDSKNIFNAISVNIINRQAGLIDSITLIFEEFFIQDKKYVSQEAFKPIYFTPKLVPNWNGHELTSDGYALIAEEIDSYLDNFII
jgi:hypothetical protein